MAVKSSAKILAAFHICPADSYRSGALWRRPSLSDTRVDKMDHRSLMTVHLAERHLAKAESTLGSFTLDFCPSF